MSVGRLIIFLLMIVLSLFGGYWLGYNHIYGGVLSKTTMEQYQYLKSKENEIRQKGKHKYAIDIERKMLRVARVVYGPISLEVARVWFRMGEEYILMSNYSMAEKCINNALNITREAIGEKNFDYITFLNKLCFVYQLEGRINVVERLYRKLIDIETQILRNSANFIALTFSNIAGVLAAQEKYDEAEEKLDSAMNMVESFHLNPLPVIKSFDVLYAAYFISNDFDKAVEIEKKLINYEKKLLGEDFPLMLSTIKKLSLAYIMAHEYGGAIDLVEKTLDRCERNKANCDIEFQIALLLDQALIYIVQRSYGDAEESFKKIHSLLGGNNNESLSPPAQGALYWTESLLYVMENKDKEAEVVLRKLFSLLKEKKLTWDDMRTPVLESFSTFLSVGMRQELCNFLEKALSIAEGLGGSSWDVVGNISVILGNFYEEKGDYTKSEHFLEKAISIYKHSKENRALVKSLEDQLLNVYKKAGHTDKAELLEKKLGISK